MSKKLYALLAVLILTCSAFYACGDDDNNNNYSMSPEWIAFNDSIYSAVSDSSKLNNSISPDPLLYQSLDCLTKNGKIHYKTINEFVITPPPTGRFSEISPKISEDGYPYSNDSVVVRYEGWYYYKDTKTGEIKKYIFDSTEENNQQKGVGFKVNGLTAGFSTMIQYMKVGEQVRVCIPYNLAYGEYTSYSSSGSLIMYGHTTLFFKILLLKIYPVNPDEFPGVDTGQ